MDPVTALSLSCNVIQLIKDAAKTGRIIYEICRIGKVEGVDDLDERLQAFDQLSDLSKKLSSQPSSNAQIEGARRLVMQALQTTSADAKLLCAELKKLKSPPNGVRRLGFAFKAAFTGSTDRVKEASSRLGKAHDELSATFMPVVVSHVQHMLSRQERNFSDLNTASQDVLKLLGTRFDAVESNLHKLEDTVIGHIDATRREAELAQSREEARLQLLASLSYNEMNDRINSISSHSESTFDWILDPSCENAKGSFASWLLGPVCHFWIRGKAGSGKSTLMKRLWSDDYLVHLLALHDQAPYVVVLKHSFWLSTSNELRKNYKGMLCALVSGILSQSTAAVEWVLSKWPAAQSFRSCGDWAEDSLEITFFDLLENHSICPRACIFLDALDEIGDAVDKRKILKLLQRLLLPQMDHIKICTSSRPERPWADKFRLASQLSLEDLTRSDIHAYARKELELELPTETATGPDEIERFFSDFASRSEGVFLWAHLAVQSLLDMSAHGSWQEVQDLLGRLPSDMMQLYNNILSRRARDVDSVKTEAATYLQLCLWSDPLGYYGDGILLHHALLVWRSHFNNEKSYCWKADEAKYHDHCTAINERILDICAGFLKPQLHRHMFEDGPFNAGSPEAHDDEQRSRCSPPQPAKTTFVFFHRTAADFLSDTPEGRSFLQRSNITPFDMLILRIDAEILYCRLFFCADPTSIPRSAFFDVALGLVGSIATFKHAYLEQDRCVKLLSAMQRLVEAISTTDSEHFRHDNLWTTDMASSVIFECARRQYLAYFIAHDIPGLFLEFGLDEWFNAKQKTYLESTPNSVKRLSSSYKNYLLIAPLMAIFPR